MIVLIILLSSILFVINQLPTLEKGDTTEGKYPSVNAVRLLF